MIDHESLVDRMTLGEQVSLLAGADFWHTTPIERLGVPSLRVSDGPAGARGTNFVGPKSLNIPCSTALGATWDPALVEQIGRLLGREALIKHAKVLLAPTVNLHRTPIGGRNFECMSEDPYLTSRVAVGYVNGVQSEGVTCCIKHFVGNDTEFERNTINSVIDERTLREMYLAPFEAAVLEAGVGAVMTGYNRINGPSCADSRILVTDVLRNEWGFEGVVISDWFGLYSTVEGVLSGVDIEMPGPTRHRGAALVDAVERGEVPADVIRERALNVIRFLDRAGAFADGSPTEDEASPGDGDDRALIRRAAAQGMVLVRNESNALPLSVDSLKTVAVIGPNARRGQLMGGGSAHVTPTHVSHPFDALSTRLAAAGVATTFAKGCSINKWVAPIDLTCCTPLEVDWFAAPTEADDPSAAPIGHTTERRPRMLWVDRVDVSELNAASARLTTAFTCPTTGRWTLAVTSAAECRVFIDDVEVIDTTGWPAGGSFFGTGKSEARVPVEFSAGAVYRIEVRLVKAAAQGFAGLYLCAEPDEVDDPIIAAESTAAAADVSVVVIGTTDDWESEGWDRDDIGLPGRQNELISRVAACSRRTIVVVNAGSPIAMPWIDDVDAVLIAWFPGQEMGEALADVLLGEVEPGGRLPITFPVALADTPAFEHHPGRNGQANYLERRLMGYRWYDSTGRVPLFPFGFGLGYAQLTIDTVEVTDAHSLSVTVSNSSDRDGAEIVQVYAQRSGEPGERDGDEPAQRLVGFARVQVPAGATVQATVALSAHMRRTWDASAHAWTQPTGPIDLCVGRSSRDLPFRLRLD